MNKIVYYVASSLDGFISGKDGDISKFSSHETVVRKYKSDLQHFDTVIMGRKTYEFGYRFGLEPGQPAYSHMNHHIFSNTMKFETQAETVQIEKSSIKRIKEILGTSRTDVYLCGGGEFAGWLFDHGLIDRLKLKLNPIVLGNGVPLFGSSKTSMTAKLIEKEFSEVGVLFLTYDLK